MDYNRPLSTGWVDVGEDNTGWITTGWVVMKRSIQNGLHKEAIIYRMGGE